MNIAEYDTLFKTIISGCKFKYFSYDHKKALEEYNTSDSYKEARLWDKNPQSWDMPEELKEKYKVERIGTLRVIYFSNGAAYKFKIGSKYPKTFCLTDFGIKVFPITLK